jgi:hypothetical protein
MDERGLKAFFGLGFSTRRGDLTGVFSTRWNEREST